MTELSIRQDLEKLESQGLLIREHSAAYLEDIGGNFENISLMNQENLDKKEIIAQKCLECIEEGDIIILDSGSTIT